jgi:hypothetical protein
MVQFLGANLSLHLIRKIVQCVCQAFPRFLHRRIKTPWRLFKLSLTLTFLIAWSLSRAPTGEDGGDDP